MSRDQLRRRTGSTLRRTRRSLSRHDLPLYAAGVTFYAALAAVPGAFVIIRLAALLGGRSHVLALGHDLARALPPELGAPQVALSLVRRGIALRWWQVLVSLLPASLYGEGLRRALAALCDTDDSFTGWRGRAALLPVLAAAPALLLVLLGVTPELRRLSGGGVAGHLLGIVVAFTVDWLVMSGPLVWVFRVVAPDPPSWLEATVGGVLTASFLAGFLQGFVLFLSLPLDLGTPFGGLNAAGGVCALLLWTWVLHLVVLLGFVLTRAVAEPPAPAPPSRLGRTRGRERGNPLITRATTEG